MRLEQQCFGPVMRLHYISEDFTVKELHLVAGDNSLTQGSAPFGYAFGIVLRARAPRVAPHNGWFHYIWRFLT
jgi:hypothetical protein